MSSFPIIVTASKSRNKKQVHCVGTYTNACNGRHVLTGLLSFMFLFFVFANVTAERDSPAPTEAPTHVFGTYSSPTALSNTYTSTNTPSLPSNTPSLYRPTHRVYTVQHTEFTVQHTQFHHQHSHEVNNEHHHLLQHLHDVYQHRFHAYFCAVMF